MLTRSFILILSVALVLCGILGLGRRAEAELVDDNTPIPAPGQPGSPMPGLSSAELDQWIRGRRVFDRDVHLEDGLGTPEYNGDSCRACHQDPAIGGAGNLDVNVFRFGNDNGGMGPFTNLPGGQVASKFRRPDFPGREDHDPAADVFEQRNPPSILGLGLVETISDADILANEDPLDLNGDGIRGVARMVDVGGGVMEVGRFGWKAFAPTLADFAHDAGTGELGLTFSDTSRGFGAQTDNDGIPDPEFDDGDLEDMIFFMRNLAPPQRKGSTNPLVALGEQIFSQIGCDLCHKPTMPGSGGPVPLYSDLLLHDIWPASFRGMAEPGADVGLYRTPPLWGIAETAPYMHDGRAETLTDAILLHDDEALAVRQAYEALTTGDREALLLFLKDL